MIQGTTGAEGAAQTVLSRCGPLVTYFGRHRHMIIGRSGNALSPTIVHSIDLRAHVRHWSSVVAIAHS